MDRLRKRNAGHKRGSGRRMSRFLGICLSAVLLLPDSLPAYAAGIGISAGDGISWEAGAPENPGGMAGEGVHEAAGTPGGEKGSGTTQGGGVSSGDPGSAQTGDRLPADEGFPADGPAFGGDGSPVSAGDVG